MNIRPDSQTLSTLAQAQQQVQNSRTAVPGRDAPAPTSKQDKSNANSRALVVQKDNNAKRLNDLSSTEDLEKAKMSASNFAREAPLGRQSLQDAAGGRNIPLGQIIDIRV